MATKRSREALESSSSSTTTTASSSHRRVTGPWSSLERLGNDVSCHLMTFLEVNALKIVVFLSRSLRTTVRSYFAILLQKSTFHISTMEMIKRGDLFFHRDFPNLNKAMEMLQILSTLKGHTNASKKVVLELERGVHEVVGSWTDPTGMSTYQKTLSVPFANLSIVGKGKGKTTIHGGLVTENGRSLSVTNLTVKNLSGHGLLASEEGTKMKLSGVTIEDCKLTGIAAQGGAKLVAKDCQICRNGVFGVHVTGSTTTTRLTNCTSHHNKYDGVCAVSGAVVDLMGEGTSVHDNERYGLCAYERGTIINVHQPCVLNDMSHGNKDQNIYMGSGGIVQQKDSKK